MKQEYILIGSRALAYWKPEFKLKPEADWDIVSSEAVEGSEWHKPSILNNSKLLNLKDYGVIEFNGKALHVVPLPYLAAIKRSHLHRDLGFGKHTTQYHRHLRGLENTDEEAKAFCEERKQLTFKEFPHKAPNLNKPSKDFFKDFVKRDYDHDYLHTLFAYEEEPLYMKLQEDKTKAWCKKSLWDELSYERKLKCVAEETMVTAAERFLIPVDWKYPAKMAYFKALDKVCTTMCSGWFREFAIDNYPELVDTFEEARFIDVKRKLENHDTI